MSDGDDTITSPNRRAFLEPRLSAGALVGEYRVVRVIGEGGMGTVYEVEGAAQRFALKMLRRELSADRAYIERFRREAIAASRIRHPNIVEVIGFEETEDERAYLVLELVEGTALSALLEDGPLALGPTLEIVRCVAAALAAAHEAGIIHRDLKPGNIIVAPDRSRAKVVDFGICKLLDGGELQRLTTTGSVVGTPAYMSPEHVENGTRVDARSDVYSLGIILFEMLIGRPPFLGDPLSVLFQHVHKDAPSLLELDPAIPSEVNELVAKALARDPAARFQTMKELAAALGYVAVGLGLNKTARPELPGRRRRKGRRSRHAMRG